MKVFIAGIIQGSKIEPEIHRQDWRDRIKQALSRHLPDAEIYCHYSQHPDSITYGLPKIRRTIAEGNRQAAASDLLVAYVPSASMGTAIEMYEAAKAGALVLTISPLAANWVVLAYSDRVFPDMESFEKFLASEDFRRLINGRKSH